jgi:hypothetical protein
MTNVLNIVFILIHTFGSMYGSLFFLYKDYMSIVFFSLYLPYLHLGFLVSSKPKYCLRTYPQTQVL